MILLPSSNSSAINDAELSSVVLFMISHNAYGIVEDICIVIVIGHLVNVIYVISTNNN